MCVKCLFSVFKMDPFHFTAIMFSASQKTTSCRKGGNADVTHKRSGSNLTPTRKTESEWVRTWTPLGIIVSMSLFSLSETFFPLNGPDWIRIFPLKCLHEVFAIGTYSNSVCPCKHSYSGSTSQDPPTPQPWSSASLWSCALLLYFDFAVS